MRLFMISLLFISSSSFSLPLENLPAGLTTDIPIGKVDGQILHINIALPARQNKTLSPVMVFIHGGGLIKGDKSKFNKHLEKMAKRGVVAASAMYRLAPEYRFPAAIEDVKSAIRFLKAHSVAFNLDPNRIIVSGISAGGYLATMVGVTGNAEGFDDHGIYPNYDASVRAVIAYSGSLADYRRKEYQDFVLVERFANNEQIDKQVALAAISPITYLDKQDPPFFLVHGTADNVVPVQMTRDFALELKNSGHEFEYIEVEGGEHSLSHSRPKQAKAVFKASMAFFKKHAFVEQIQPR